MRPKHTTLSTKNYLKLVQDKLISNRSIWKSRCHKLQQTIQQYVEARYRITNELAKAKQT